METVTQKTLYLARVQRHGEEAVKKLKNACVGIAGLGGLGSHIAISLARMGVGKLVLADFDRVDITNLHRQHYFVNQIGYLKTEALADTLRKIDPWIQLELYPVRLTPENIPTIFGSCPILCEAFDKAEEKAMLLETALAELPHITVVSGSGDGKTDVAEYGSLFASRVAVCAGHQAHMVLRLLLGEDDSAL